MKKTLITLGLIFCFIFCFITTNVKADTITPPEINAEGCALIDASTGKVLYEKNIGKIFEPASTTKVMTALIALEKCNLNDEVTIQEDFTNIDGTAIGLLKGDVLTVHELLLGLLLESGNDCANALAIHISGSIEEFSKLMNIKAKELGALNTNFKNPSGLPDPEHTTTPEDLALFMKEAINNKDFMDISTTSSYKIAMINNPERTILLNNKNYLINKNSKYYYKYAISGKNGYTTKSNHTYVAAAEKDGHILVASFLNALDKNQNFFDMASVFNYGFDNFTSVPLYKKGEKIAEYKLNSTLTIPLIAADDINYIAQKGEETNVSPEIKLEDKDLSKESFNIGDKILKGTIYINDKEYLTIDLESGVSREYVSPMESIASTTTRPSFILPIIIIGVVIISAIYIKFSINRKSRKKRFKHLKKSLESRKNKSSK